MIVEKPSWIKHEGLQIFSIDIQPGGHRFATGGGDHKVRIWNMKSVSKEMESDEATQKLLATLRDHFGSVNCVRWAKHGRFLASGSDDHVILVHERRPGRGTTEFGSGEPPDVENWKVVMTLRGHTADVVDLNWSPDDSMLASGSLDNTVHIWNMTNGICTAVLRGHSSLVKGVAWDPIGSFVASQSDDKTVIIWRTSNWSLAHRTEGHWSKSLGSTFFRRLGWSPCGHFITTTHGFQKPRHSAPVLERGEWSATFDFLGHNAPVIVAKFNHSMFWKTVSNGKEVPVAPVGWSNGITKSSSKEGVPYNIIAIGGQDHTITVWTTASARPLMVAKHFFTQSVVDLSWSPDGYMLLACSLDGTGAIFLFEANELGQRLSDSELDDLKRNRYGDARGRHANLAESPAQLLLEAASTKQSAAKKGLPGIEKERKLERPSVENLDKAHENIQPSQDKVEDAQIGRGASADGSMKPVPTRVSSPVKQKEYRRPDGRKRIIPEAVGGPISNEFASLVSSQHQREEDDALHAGGARRISDKTSLNGISGASNVCGKYCHCGIQQQSGCTARTLITESLLIEKAAGVPDGGTTIDHPGAMGPLELSHDTLSIQVFDKNDENSNMPVTLTAKLVERSKNDVVGASDLISFAKETEISCRRDDQILWSDKITGKVNGLAGNTNFWAVGCEDGCLQIYTKRGRRILPIVMLGSAAAFIDCDGSWKLLIITKRGAFYVWDLFKRACLVHDSLASLVPLSDDPSVVKVSVKVISARFSRSGMPLVVLSNRRAFLFDLGLMCWLRVADDCFPASNFTSSGVLSPFQNGELGALQVAVGKFVARKPGWSRVTDDGVQTRAHLETQMASALALKSSHEYRQCLLSYIRYLAREGDESRLREVCEGFLGPPTGMAEASPSHSANPPWDPCVLGMKKHKLLKEDILPAMASNRKVQRLLNEFMDLLSEYESSANDQNGPKHTSS